MFYFFFLSNSIADEGATALANALQKLPQLQSLNLNLA